jgi:hypothetical protein
MHMGTYKLDLKEMGCNHLYCTPVAQNTAVLLLFMSTGRDCVSELRPSMGLLFIPQMIYEYEATVE